MYNFNMDQLLKSFNNNPEELAQAFTAQLNAKLAEEKAKEDLKKQAESIAKSWNVYVSDYFKLNKITANPVDYNLSGNDVETILKSFIEFDPTYKKILENINKMDEICAKAKPAVKDIKTNLKTAYDFTTNRFDDIMRDFFSKNDI